MPTPTSAPDAFEPLPAAPQLEYYAAERSGRTAIIHTRTGRVAAWVVRDGVELRARHGMWISDTAETIPQVIRLVALRARG